MSQSSNEDSYSQRFPDRRFYEGDNNWSSCDEVEDDSLPSSPVDKLDDFPIESNTNERSSRDNQLSTQSTPSNMVDSSNEIPVENETSPAAAARNTFCSSIDYTSHNGDSSVPTASQMIRNLCALPSDPPIENTSLTHADFMKHGPAFFAKLESCLLNPSTSTIPPFVDTYLRETVNNDSFEWDVDGEFDKNESFTYWNGEKSITNMKKD